MDVGSSMLQQRPDMSAIARHVETVVDPRITYCMYELFAQLAVIRSHLAVSWLLKSS